MSNKYIVTWLGHSGIAHKTGQLSWLEAEEKAWKLNRNKLTMIETFDSVAFDSAAPVAFEYANNHKKTQKSLRARIQELKSSLTTDMFKFDDAPINRKNVYVVARGEGIHQAHVNIIASLDTVLITFKGRELRKEANYLLDSFSDHVVAFSGFPIPTYIVDTPQEAMKRELVKENWTQQVSVYKKAYNELLAILKPDQYEIYAYEM